MDRCLLSLKAPSTYKAIVTAGVFVLVTSLFRCTTYGLRYGELKAEPIDIPVYQEDRRFPDSSLGKSRLNLDLFV